MEKHMPLLIVMPIAGFCDSTMAIAVWKMLADATPELAEMNGSRCWAFNRSTGDWKR